MMVRSNPLTPEWEVTRNSVLIPVAGWVNGLNDDVEGGAGTKGASELEFDYCGGGGDRSQALAELRVTDVDLEDQRGCLLPLER
jgi:hypothetical protein